MDKVTNAFAMTGYEIFSPFNDLKRGGDVFISTWGLGTVIQMQPIIKVIKSAKVSLLVGYSKSSHNLGTLLYSIQEYKLLGWNIRVLPSFHGKIWFIGDKAWVGSANFVRGTITNIMVEVPKKTVQDFVSLNWQQGFEVSSTTKLELIPQAKVKLK